MFAGSLPLSLPCPWGLHRRVRRVRDPLLKGDEPVLFPSKAATLPSLILLVSREVCKSLGINWGKAPMAGSGSQSQLSPSPPAPGNIHLRAITIKLFLPMQLSVDKGALLSLLSLGLVGVWSLWQCAHRGWALFVPVAFSPWCLARS